ncbi:MAG: NifU N-terminal domain-containing protein [Nitrospinaceae bacterium]
MADVLVESTPNENALKYTVVGKQVLDKGHKTYSSPEDAGESPIATTLFQIDGVTSVFMMADFITVTKQPEAKWDEIQGKAKDAIQEAYG